MLCPRRLNTKLKRTQSRRTTKAEKLKRKIKKITCTNLSKAINREISKRTKSKLQSYKAPGAICWSVAETTGWREMLNTSLFTYRLYVVTRYAHHYIYVLIKNIFQHRRYVHVRFTYEKPNIISTPNNSNTIKSS